MSEDRYATPEEADQAFRKVADQFKGALDALRDFDASRPESEIHLTADEWDAIRREIDRPCVVRPALAAFLRRHRALDKGDQ